MPIFALYRTFDDSMKSLTNGMKPWTTKLSSAGLVYLHFGKRVIAMITGNPGNRGEGTGERERERDRQTKTKRERSI